MFADRQLSFAELQEQTKINLTEDEYIEQFAENIVQLERSLQSKKSVLNTADFQSLHQIMNNKLDRNAGVVDGNRHLKFFDNKGKRNMADGQRLQQELKLLERQTKDLMKRAGNDNEEKIKAVCIQAMRLFSIHPFNDANKRMVKLTIRHFLEKELKVKPQNQWQEIPRKVINQAVRGNNIGPFARMICETYSIQYDPKKITEVEISPYRIYPDTSDKVYSLRKELKKSCIRKGNAVSYREPIISREELKLLGIESSFFKKNPVCKDLLSSLSTASFLRKIKRYHAQGKLSDFQAESLVKKLIITTDGAEEKNCELATKKFLRTEMNDIKKAVRFYEKEAVDLNMYSVKEKISLYDIEETSEIQREKEKTLKV